MYSKLTHFSPVLRFIYKPVVLQRETNDWSCKAKQMTGFYIKCNPGLKWLNNITHILSLFDSFSPGVNKVSIMKCKWDGNMGQGFQE